MLTSTLFKLVSVRKELGQLIDFVRKLHDRQALVKREARRRFLGGEGFVAWPGPALRAFVDDFIVHNRMLSKASSSTGAGAVTLGDLRAPVLYFVGTRDEIARPRAIRAVAARRAGPRSSRSRCAGHFGLVVGGTANRATWPTVTAWVLWRDGEGPRPALLFAPPATDTAAMVARGEDEEQDGENAAIVEAVDIGSLRRRRRAGSAWSKLGEAFVDIGDTADALRYQLPRLPGCGGSGRDAGMAARSRIRARAIPDRTFFLWKGRAFSYADADRRVDNVVRGLLSCGVRPGDRVGVIMEGRPSYLDGDGVRRPAPSRCW